MTGEVAGINGGPLEIESAGQETGWDICAQTWITDQVGVLCDP
jgi:hypothetical protein